MFWDSLTSEEIGRCDKSLPVLLPIASIEQHGAHLPTSTDSSINELLLKGIEAEMSDKILILPITKITCSKHHMDFPGSLTVSHQTFYHYVTDILNAVLQNGFKTIVIFNSHGGNQGIGQVLVESFGSQNPDVKILCVSWWKIAVAELRELNESGFKGVGHACEFETSLMELFDPKTVRKDKIHKADFNPFFSWEEGDLLQAPTVSFYKSMKTQTNNGVYGDPTYANKQKGERIKKIVVEKLKQILLDITK